MGQSGRRENEMNFDDEICDCGHSKGYHKAHALDVHGGSCEKCECKIYTWKRFITYLNFKIEKLKQGAKNENNTL